MKTDELWVTQEPEMIADALDKIEWIALYTGMTRRDASSMRLLAEELLSATKDILAAYEGRLWMETSDEQFALHVIVRRPTGKADREKLIALSKNGTVTPPKGMFARLSAAMEKLLLLDDDELGTGILTDYAMYAGGMHGDPSIAVYTYHYLTPEDRAPKAAEAPADELSGIEKSIIDAIVDDIRVTARSGNVEITAIKNLNK